MEIYSTSQARAHLFQLVSSVGLSHQPICIVGKKDSAVLLSTQDYRSMVETLYLMSIPGMKESILSVKDDPEDSFVHNIEWDDV